MSEYRIEKLRRHMAVILTTGERLEGDVFLQSMSRFRPRAEAPIELFNDDDPFFALADGDGARIVAKANVAHVEMPLEEGDDEHDFASLGVPVEVTLVGGGVCTGSIFIEARADRQRLKDFLNAYRHRFLPVIDIQRIFLVNTHTIAHVREVA